MSIFADTLSVMSRKGLEISITQEEEFINDFLEDKILSVGSVSFHPRHKQIVIEGNVVGEAEYKTYEIVEPSAQLIKFMFSTGNSGLKKYVYHYSIQNKE